MKTAIFLTLFAAVLMTPVSILAPQTGSGIGVAWAQTNEGSAAERAKAHFERGAELYYEANYAEALEEFASGHALVPNALFVYNMMLCNFRMGRLERALQDGIEARRLDALPLDEATKTEARISAISSTLAARAIASNSARAPGDSARSDRPPEVGEQSSSMLSTGGWVGVGLLGTGVLALASMLVIDASINSAWEDYTEAVARADFDLARQSQSRIERDQTIGKVVFFSGLGVSAAGAVLLVLDLIDSDESPVVQIQPNVDGGFSVGTRIEF